jgi:hypothetical protein
MRIGNIIAGEDIQACPHFDVEENNDAPILHLVADALIHPEKGVLLHLQDANSDLSSGKHIRTQAPAVPHLLAHDHVVQLGGKHRLAKSFPV